jgi:hypothetical protein
MTVGELREIIKNVPDAYEVTILMHYADEAIYQNLHERRMGIRGLVAELVDPLPTEFTQNFHSWV